MSFHDHPDLAAWTLDALDQGILVQGPGGRVLACNQAAARVLGCARGELEGAPSPLPAMEPGEHDVPLPDGSGSVAVRVTEGTWEGGPATVLTLRPTPPPPDEEPADTPRLREFVEQAPGGFFVSSLDGRVLAVSPGMEEILGRTQEEIQAKGDPTTLVHPEDRDALRRLVADPDRTPYETTYRLLRPDGTVRWVRQRAFPLTDGRGRVDRVVGTLEDVTDQREEEELLVHTLRLLRRTVSSLQEGVLVVDTAERSGRILSANPAARRIFGYTPEELVGESTAKLHVDASSFRAFEKAALETLAETEVFRSDHPMRRKDGTVFPAQQTVAWLDPEEGMAGGVVLVVRDLSEQRRAEAELRASEERFRLIAERIDDVFWISSVDNGTMEYVSPAYEKIWGRPPRELLDDSTRWADHLVEEDRERVLAALPQQRLGTFEEEYRIRRPDGEIRWVWDRAFPVEDENGEVTRIIGVAEDITDRKRAEERFSVLSREISDVLYVLDPDGEVRFTSPSVRHTLGYTPEEFRGSNILALVHPDDRDRIRAQLRAIEDGNGEASRAQYRMHTRGGEILHVESIARNLMDNPAVEGIVVTTRDVTERLELEEQLLQSQKMDAVGRLAGGIAHDFNNLLTVIRAQTDLLLLDLDEDDPVRREIETIQSTGDRAADLTSQLLAFSREQILRPRVVDLGGVVRGMGTLLERIIGEDIRVEHELSDDLPPVRVDPGQLEHVVMNLAINARDAMPSGGTLTLATGMERVEREDGGPPGIDSGDYVALRVTDTGMGMDERTRLRIFEPFFTTKPTGEGTGLGLAMAHGVVHQSGGDIQVRSKPGAGTTFILRFPAVWEEPAAPTAAPPRRAPGRPMTGTVILVEDDGDVRRVAARILERAGLTVRATDRAEEGLELLESAPEEVHLLLTDLVLPGMSGRELVDRTRQARPELPIVVMSGYAADSPGHRGDLPAEIGFLQKPFEPGALVSAVRNALQGAPRQK